MKDKKIEEMIDQVVSEGVTEDVADVIYQQLGGSKAKAMLGMKNISKGMHEGNPYLGFNIGGNSSGINHIRIILNGKDLYDVEFGKIRGMDYDVLKTVEDVFASNLKDVIEEETGMYLSL